jgi:hypothetical protein
MPTTAAEYRRYAHECIQFAREAASEPVRKQFLDIAKLWLTAAERQDARSGVSAPTKGDGHAAADAGVEGTRPNDTR